MSYQRERDQFINTMAREGLPLHVTLMLLRETTGINRRAELACSSEAADRDRVPCPALVKYGRYIEDMPVDNIRPDKYPCLCDQDIDEGRDGNPAPVHTTITRITLQDWHAEERIRRVLADCNCGSPDGEDHHDPCLTKWQFLTTGDPRGYTLRVIPPSYAARNAGRDHHNLESIGVPAGASGLRF